MRVTTASILAALAIITTGCNQPTTPEPVAESKPAESPDDKPASLDPPAKNAAREETPRSLPAAETAFAALVAAAKDSDFDAWTAAEQTLTELGARAVPTLAKQLSDDDQFARELAAQFLAQLGPEAAEAEKELTQALKDDSEMVRANAAATLLTLNVQTAEAETVLRDLLTSADPGVRLPAAISLSGNEAAAEDAVAVLTELLAEPHDDGLRLPAVEALGRLGETAKSSLNAVRLLTSVENDDLQTAAREAARKIEGGIDETSETIPVGGVEP